MSETPNGLRGEMAAACFDPGAYVGPRGARTTDQWRADACIAGPLAPFLAQVSALQAEVERLQKGLNLAADEATSHRNAAVAALRERDAVLERLQKVEGEFAEASRRSVALWQDKYEAAKAELRAVDMAFGGVADSERAERILQWIGEAADAETRASVAEAESEALSLMLADCIAALSQVPLANLPGAVEMMVTSAMEAPIQGALSRQHLAKVAAERMNAFRSALQKVEGEREKDAERVPSGPCWSDKPEPQSVSALRATITSRIVPETLREISAQATPGPWVSSKWGYQILTGDSWNTVCTFHSESKDFRMAEWEDGRKPREPWSNAAFVVAAVNFVRELIASAPCDEHLKEASE